MSEFSQFQTEIVVRPSDIDMNKHVHNSKYLDYVLAGRCDQMERCYGMSMEAFTDRNLGWFVKDCYIEHKRQLVMGDKVLVKTQVEELHKRGVKVSFQILRQADKKVSASGYFNYLMVYADSGKPATLTDEVIAKFSI